MVSMPSSCQAQPSLCLASKWSFGLRGGSALVVWPWRSTSGWWQGVSLLQLPTAPSLCCREQQRSWLYRIRPSVTHEPFHPLNFPAEQVGGTGAAQQLSQLAWQQAHHIYALVTDAPCLLCRCCVRS